MIEERVIYIEHSPLTSGEAKFDHGGEGLLERTVDVSSVVAELSNPQAKTE